MLATHTVGAQQGPFPTRFCIRIFASGSCSTLDAFIWQMIFTTGAFEKEWLL